MNTKRLMLLALAGAWIAPASYLSAAQQEQQSVADAARKAQADKKNAPKAKITLDNDNLDTLKGVVNVVGGAPATAAQPDKNSTDSAAAAAKPAPNAAVKDQAYWQGKFAAANSKLADDSRELDLTQREFNLKQQQFYTDPMATLKQNYSRDDINNSKTKIDELTAKVAQDKADIANLEDEMRKAGGDPGWASQPAQPSQGARAQAEPQELQPAPSSGPSGSAQGDASSSGAAAGPAK